MGCGGEAGLGVNPGPPQAHTHTHTLPSRPEGEGRRPAAVTTPRPREKRAPGRWVARAARPLRAGLGPRGAARGSPGPPPSPHPFFARAFASPLFLCVCLCVDFLTLLPHPANSGYLWLRRHSPFSPPPRVYPTGGVASAVPLCKLFSIPSPSPSRALAAGPLASVQLSCCRPIELGESPDPLGRAGAGAAAAAAGAGTPAGPTFSGARLASLPRSGPARTFAPAQWATGSGERDRAKPPDESLVECEGLRFFFSFFLFLPETSKLL